jgi:hypothetical protein
MLEEITEDFSKLIEEEKEAESKANSRKCDLVTLAKKILRILEDK